MKNPTKHILSGVSLAVALASGHAVAADSIAEALETGKAYGDFRLRYESVDQDNALEDASALTLRTRFGYTTGSISGFSATMEFEDSRIVAAEDEYSVGPTGFNILPAEPPERPLPRPEYSIIGDPETTEVDQGYIQYKGDSVTVKAGRQLLTLDNHRFIGHVGWRQDRQTFDALSVVVTPVDDLTISAAYLGKRNRIFAEAADVDSKDVLLNVAYKTPVGKLTGYSYQLEVDQAADNALDTYGLRFAGATDAGGVKVHYGAEFAEQKNEAEGREDYKASYQMLEGGVTVAGVTIKAGYEVLGSDDEAYGFSTPLATGHKFNGWADQFLGTPGVGLVDTSISFSGKLAGGKWVVAYHDYEADDSRAAVEATDTTAAVGKIDDLGDELNVLYARKFGKHYNAGIKYASYSAGDAAAGKVDTDKMWVWVGASF